MPGEKYVAPLPVLDVYNINRKNIVLSTLAKMLT